METHCQHCSDLHTQIEALEAQIKRLDTQLGQACDDWDGRQKRREQHIRQQQDHHYQVTQLKSVDRLRRWRDAKDQIARALDAGDLHQAKRIAGMLGWH